MIQYFGTTLDEAGHYLFVLSGQLLRKAPMARFYELPFNPEGLPHFESDEPRINGVCKFYHFAGYTILAIEGSCYDKRPGSKSIFFIHEILPEEQFKQMLKATPIVQQIVKQMPFMVMW